MTGLSVVFVVIYLPFSTPLSLAYPWRVSSHACSAPVRSSQPIDTYMKRNHNSVEIIRRKDASLEVTTVSIPSSPSPHPAEYPPRSSSQPIQAPSSPVSRKTLFPPSLPHSFSSSSDKLDFDTIAEEISQLKKRVNSMEKSILSGKPYQGKNPSTKSAAGKWVDGVTTQTIPMSRRTIQICSIISFAFIGMIVGASLLDRLWLLGGVAGSYWASDAVSSDTKWGSLARYVGSQFAQTVIDIQEKHNQAIIFYRTGKLAYVSSKTWDEYDSKFQITKRLDELKKRAKKRAAKFNTVVAESDLNDKIKDMWDVILRAPTQARYLDEEYGISTKMSIFIRGLAGEFTDLVDDVFDRRENPGYRRRNKGKRRAGLFSRKKTRRKSVSPWASPL